jgi:hypothetical protein
MEIEMVNRNAPVVNGGQQSTVTIAVILGLYIRYEVGRKPLTNHDRYQSTSDYNRLQPT